MAQQYSHGAIWTTHALERLAERKLPQQMAGVAFSQPDKMTHGRKGGATEFYKRFGDHHVSVIAKQNEKNEWVIISAWIDPPMPGTRDFRKKEIYKKYKKAGFWGKAWLSLKKQLYG